MALSKSLRNFGYSSISVVAFLLIWQVTPLLGRLFQDYVIPPTTVALTIYRLFVTGELAGHILVSFQRAVGGFVIASIIGIPLGFLLGGSFPRIDQILGPILAFFGKLNPFSLFPLFVMLLGIGELAKTGIVAWVCVWPILSRTVTGTKEIDPTLIKVAKSMHCGPTRLFFSVILPGAIPEIFSGLQMACSTSFFILIAAEMIGATRGLGWLVWNAQMNFLIPKLFAATVVISVLGLAINWGLKLIERRLLLWRPNQTS